MLEHPTEPGETVGSGAVAPIGVREQRREHRAMDMGVLSQVDRGQVEAERFDATQQPLHAEQSRVLAAVLAQARDDHPQITLELGRDSESLRRLASSRLQPSGDKAEQHAIRHVVIARRDRCQRLGELGAIGRHALAHGVAHAGECSRLRQPACELGCLPAIPIEREVALPAQSST